MQPLISIIVPVFNVEKYLEKCLISLQKQTYQNIEIILIDDGSTDGSSEICKAFCGKDSRFQYIAQENSGVSKARNKGLDIAKGEYLAFCDSDDWVDEDTYESLYNLLVSTSSDISIVSFVLEDGKDKEVVDDLSIYTFDKKQAILEMHRGEYFQGHLCNKLIKRQLLGYVRFQEDIAIYEDMLFMWQVFHNAKKVVFQNIHKYHYVHNVNSALYGKFRESYWSVQSACEQMLDLMKTYYSEEIVYAEKTLLIGNFSVAQKLEKNGLLNKENYLKVKNAMVRHYRKEVKSFFDKKLRLQIRTFLISRVLFILLRKSLFFVKKLVVKNK